MVGVVVQESLLYLCHLQLYLAGRLQVSSDPAPSQGAQSYTLLTCREMSLICTSSVLHFPKSLMSGVSATAGAAVSHSVILRIKIVKAQAYVSLTLRPV